MLFGTIRFAEFNSDDLIAKMVAQAELNGKPTADIFTGVYWITDLQEFRWFAYRYYSDTVSFSPGDFVAFDTGQAGDVLRGKTSGTGLALAPFAFNLQAGYRVPEIAQRKVVGWQNVLRNSLTDQQICTIEKVLARISR